MKNNMYKEKITPKKEMYNIKSNLFNKKKDIIVENAASRGMSIELNMGNKKYNVLTAELLYEIERKFKHYDEVIAIMATTINELENKLFTLYTNDANINNKQQQLSNLLNSVISDEEDEEDDNYFPKGTN